MSSDQWETRKLEDVLDALIDYRGKTPRKTNSGVPLITAKIVKNGFIQEPDEFITEEDYDSWMVRGLPEVGDIVLTTEAPLGEVAQLKSRKVALAQRIVTLRGKRGVLDNGFLKYFFQSSIGQSRLREKETGTTVTGIKQAELRKVEIDYPPIQTQQRIASILSALDDKIELNRQTNATLEAIAQAIFKAWFVDFEFPGDTGERVDSELGLIPAGWRVRRLGEICEFVKGVSYRSSELQPSTTALVTLKSINRGGGFNFDGFKEYVGDYWDMQLLNEGDLVISQTDITQNADVVGCPAIIENPFDYERLIASLDLVICKPITEMISTEVLYYFLRYKDFKDYCLSHTNGSTVLHLRSSEIPNYMFVFPDVASLNLFDAVVKSTRQFIVNTNRQIKSLMQIRDTLLPKLIGGEIDI